MSETLSRDPESMSSGYTLAPSYPAQSSSDQPGSHLPPFSSFAVEMDASTGFNFTESRILDMPQWEYYHETRLLDRVENGIIVSQAQYRPWESKPIDAHATFADAFAQNGVSKLPSFQSQFQSFNDPVTTSEPTLTTLTPVSPSVSSPNLTTLGTVAPNFHTLNARNYPLVPAPIQAREIPSIQQQFLDERHIQLYTHPTGFPTQNGTIIQNISAAPTVVTVVKTEPDFKLTLHPDPNMKLQSHAVTLHPTQFQNPMSTIIDNTGLYNGLDKKINGINVSTIGSPTRSDFRKKERRKMRASSLESSAESDGASSNMEIGNENSGQVAAVSSTAGYKHHSMSANSMDMDDMNGGCVDKQVKKKRKRCGECIGCQRKDNCGDCAPCRNDKSHQICKQRRCEKLTEKKNLYGEPNFARGESRRGRGKGRGGGTYRGRKAAAAAAISNNAVNDTPVPVSRPSPQPAVHMIKQEPVQQQSMAPVSFYTDPNRFATPVWQADPTIAPQEVVPAWPQGQFIQQIAPAQPQTTLDGYPTQQYPNGLYQTTYQQPAFEPTNTFYTGAVQVLTSTRPPSASNQQLTPRTNGSYTPSPSPVTQNQPQQQQSQQTQQQQAQQPQGVPSQQTQNNGQRPNLNAYDYMQNYAPPATPPNDNQQQPSVISRPNSVNGNNAPTPNQTYPQANNSFTSVSSTSFSPSSNSTPHYVNANSGNEQPGYPQVSSNPPLVSHNSSGYPGQFGGNSMPNNQQNSEQHQLQQSWVSNDNAHMMWQQAPAQPSQHIVNQQQTQDQMSESAKQQDNNITNQYENENNHHDPGDQFNQAHRVNLNSRIKTMILNKQEKKMEEVQKDEHNKQTGHFLWYSHHRRLDDIESDGGGFPSIVRQNPRFQHLNHDNFYNTNLNYNHNQFNYFHANLMHNQFANNANGSITETNDKNDYGMKIEQVLDNNVQLANSSVGTLQTINPIKQEQGGVVGLGLEDNKVKTNVGNEIPKCNCFPSGNLPPEPGTYYTHLGCSSNLANLRKDFEHRTGVNGKAIRIEKIKYTGKEGKSAQGCPIAKWIIRRSDYHEKYLIMVKQRQGHFCFSAFIVVCIVAWDGVPQSQANDLYKLLTDKLNQYGLPTARRCGTNEQRTCACQGLYPENCGASFSFGCSWSMYYNGCKFARSKCVRKFRLSAQNEEQFMEEKLQALATYLVPLYKNLAPIALKNQCSNEIEDMECRLGAKTAERPFSGVTACLDFCSHSHKDTHNMNDGCTVVVSLTKERVIGKPKHDEQLHVLPLYTVDTTDEFGSSQDQKIKNNSIEILKSYKCEVRMRTVPLQSCRRRKKTVKNGTTSEIIEDNISTKKKSAGSLLGPGEDINKDKPQTTSELQNNQITSTVNHYINHPQLPNHPSMEPSHPAISDIQGRYQRHENPVLDNWNNPRTAFNVTYPVITPYSYTPTQYNLPPMQNTVTANMQYTRNGMMAPLHHHFAVNQKVQDSNSGSNSTSNRQLVIDYDQHRMPIQQFRTPYYHQPHHLNDYNCSYPVSFNPNPYEYQRQIMPALPSLNWSHPTPSFSNVDRILPPLSTFQMHSSSQTPLPHLPMLPSSSLGTPSVLTQAPVDINIPKPAIGTVKEISENLESFKDSTIGGLAIALSHGSVLFECAKYEFHSTTALKSPNRLNPTRISLVFYQHRNLNKPKHGWDAYEEKMRLRKMGVSVSPAAVSNSVEVSTSFDAKSLPAVESHEKLLHPLSGVASFHTYVPLQPMQMPNLYQSTFGI